jgi:uncharacterized membrane protein
MEPHPTPFHLQEQQMSARKLSRLAGLVFVLTAVFGGAGAASASIGAESADSVIAVEARASMSAFDTVWG